MYLDGFGKFLVIFVLKYFFTLVNKFWVKKSLFCNFSEIQFLAKNMNILMYSSWNSLSRNVYFYILYFISF